MNSMKKFIQFIKESKKYEIGRHLLAKCNSNGITKGRIYPITKVSNDFVFIQSDIEKTQPFPKYSVDMYFELTKNLKDYSEEEWVEESNNYKPKVGDKVKIKEDPDYFGIVRKTYIGGIGSTVEMFHKNRGPEKGYIGQEFVILNTKLIPVDELEETNYEKWLDESKYQNVQKMLWSPKNK